MNDQGRVKLVSDSLQRMQQVELNDLLQAAMHAAVASLQKLAASGRVLFTRIKFVFVFVFGDK